MKISTFCRSALASAILAVSVSAVAAPTFNSDMDKVSYSIGYDLGSHFQQQGISVNPSLFTQGLNDGLQNSTPALTQAQMQQVMQTFQKQMMQKMAQQQEQAASTNQTASTAYLQKIAGQPGVVKLQDGLYYKVVTAGNGPMPKATDTVTVNYKGTLSDGTVFDSSYARKQPATFQLNQVIPGWTAALQKMPVGSTWMIYMSPDLGYGQYAPPSIGPNQALTFQVQLISINPPQTQS